MTSTILDELKGVLGETASSEFEVTHYLSTGYPPLDKIISGSYHGGMPTGRIVEMFGPSSCGKTAIATAVMAEAVRQGGFACFMDHERSFDIGLARDLGLDDASGRFAHVKPRTLEESFMRALNTAVTIRDKGLIPKEAPIVTVFDSLAAMVPNSKMQKELDELTMADSLALAKATSTALPAVKIRAEECDMLVLILNQVRENPGVMYGDNTRTPGGKAPAFYSDVRIKLRAKPIKDGKERKGQTITAECVKTKLTAPFKSTEWDFLFREDGSGEFDVISGMIEEACQLGIMEKKGARIEWQDKSQFKSQWKTAMVVKPELLEELTQAIMETDEE